MRVAPLALALFIGASGLVLAADQSQPATAAQNSVCLPVSQIRNTNPISDQEILFRMSNGKTWKNTLVRACHGLKFERGFSWEIRGGTVCSNMQVIYVLHTGTPCFLGEFTPYDASRTGALR